MGAVGLRLRLQSHSLLGIQGKKKERSGSIFPILADWRAMLSTRREVARLLEPTGVADAGFSYRQLALTGTYQPSPTGYEPRPERTVTALSQARL
jgi:hypothetical protein